MSEQGVVRSEPRFGRWGRYLVRQDNGSDELYMRATTLAKTCEDEYGLGRWRERMVALGLASRPDYLAKVAACRDDEKDKLDELVEQAKEAAAASSGANIGGALHAFTARLDAGESLSAPPPSDADLAVYQERTAQARIKFFPEWIERMIVLDELAVAGTFDRIVGVGADHYIADIKTAQDLAYSWNAIAVQLALYANAGALYDPGDDTRAPMPTLNKQKGLIIHLPAGQGRCDFYWVDLVEGWKGVQLSLSVQQWRKRKDLHTPVEADVLDPVATHRAWLIERISVLKAQYPEAYADVVASWPPDISTFRNCDEHNIFELSVICRVLDDVEARHRVLFPSEEKSLKGAQRAV